MTIKVVVSLPYPLSNALPLSESEKRDKPNFNDNEKRRI